MSKTLGHGSLVATLSTSIANVELRLSSKIRQFEELVASLRLDAALLKDLGSQSSATGEAAPSLGKLEDAGEDMSDSQVVASSSTKSNDSPATSDDNEAFSFMRPASESRRKRSIRCQGLVRSRTQDLDSQACGARSRSQTQTWPLENGQDESDSISNSPSIAQTLPPLITLNCAPIASPQALSSEKQPPANTLASLALQKQRSISPSPSFTSYRQQLAASAQPPAVSSKRNARGRYSELMARMTQAVLAARFGKSSAVSDANLSPCNSPGSSSRPSSVSSNMNVLPNLMATHTGDGGTSSLSHASRKSTLNLPQHFLMQDHDALDDREDQFCRTSLSSARTNRGTSCLSGELSTGKSSILPSSPSFKRPAAAADEFRLTSEEQPKRDTSHSNMSFHSETLSVLTPDTGVELLPFWQDMKRKSRASSKKKQTAPRGSASNRSMVYSDPVNSADMSSVFGPTTSTSDAREGYLVRFIARHVMMAPTSPRSVCWDMLGMIFITYDFICMPLEAFSLPETAFTISAERTVMIFWTLTIPRSLLVGYMQEDGEIVLNPLKVMKRYVTSWFIIDLVIVGCDWAGVILQNADSLGMVRITKIVRIARIMRIARVARMLKAPALTAQFVERFQSEKALLVMGIAVHSCMFVGLVHILACLWYLLGKEMADEANRTWISVYDLDVAAFSYKYATSLHWAATQFIGTMEVNPQNNPERIFAAVVCILSFIISTAFVSLLTSKITRLQMISESWENQFSILRRYCQHHRIPSMLTMRVMRSARHALRMQQKHVLEKDIELLTVISEPLQMEMRSKIFAPLMCRSPFFEELNSICFRTMRRLCHFATNVLPMQTGDILFQAGEAPKVPRMFFVMSGNLSYGCCSCCLPACHGDYFCEAALWTCWVHTGDMIAASDSNVLEIRFEGFRQQINSAVNDVKFYAASYAEAYVKALNQMKDVMELSQHIDTGKLAREARDVMGRRLSS